MSKKRITYSLALATMATTLSALHAYADDTMSPGTEARPPQVYSSRTITTTTSTAPTVAPTVTPGVRTLGVIPASSAPVAPPPSPVNVMIDDTMRPQQAGDITFMTGGIGDEERSALDAAKPDYNLHIMSANKDGTFIGDERIAIRDKKGDTLLDASAGPLFYAKLPAGSYTVEASKNGQTQQHKLAVGAHGAANLHFSW